MKKKSRASIVEVQSKLAKVGTDVIVPDAAAATDNGAAIEAETSVSGGTTNGNGNLNGDHEEEDMDTTTSSSLAFNGNGSRIGNGSADYLEYFNSDIICHHGQLCIQEVKRKLVCGNVWKKFKSYFPTARAFPKSSMPCNFCMENDDKVKKAIEDKKELANSQKNALSDIFNERCRPSWARTSTERVYLVPRA
jgi:hypothetical protein